jgi:methionine sulfoxide reductase heme-binding subunit
MSFTLFRIAVFVLSLAPFLWLGWDTYNADLGTDPVQQITHRTGAWALRFLLISLAVTPLRRLSGWNELIKLRRMLGLYAFFYASMHLSTYLVLDLGGFWSQIFADIVKRPFITVGFLAWLLMLPLALTSTKGMMRRLGRRWQVLHRLVYACAGLAVLHFIWLVKADLVEPLIYLGCLLVLLAFRLYWKLKPRVAMPAPASHKPL